MIVELSFAELASLAGVDPDDLLSLSNADETYTLEVKPLVLEELS